MKSIRESFYKTALELGLFYLMPIVVRLPKSLSRQILKLKAATRFLLGSYRAYVDRPGLKDIAISNIIETLKTDKISRRILYRLMQLEVFAEKNGFSRIPIHSLTWSPVSIYITWNALTKR